MRKVICAIVALATVLAACSCGAQVPGEVQAVLNLTGSVDSLVEVGGTIYFVESGPNSEPHDATALRAFRPGHAPTTLGMVEIADAEVPCTAPHLSSFHTSDADHFIATADCSGRSFVVNVNVAGVRPQARVVAPVPSSDYYAVWPADADKGWITRSEGLCQSIGSFSSAGIGGIGPIQPEFPWKIDAELRSSAIGTECDRSGEAWAVGASADGRRLYFMAAPNSAGLAEPQRRNVEWSLYVLDAETHAVTTIADGFTKVVDADLSPDGSRVAVAATRTGTVGLWIVDTQSNAVRKVAPDHYLNTRFTHNGRIVASYLDGSRSSIVVADGG